MSLNFISPIFQVLVHPGFLFIVITALAFSWIDRKLIARFEGRVGPPWYQPLADLIKLLGKEDILPEGTNEILAKLLPVFSFAAVLTAGFMLPLEFSRVSSFEGDFIVVVFLLSAPSLFYFLAGWTTSGVYSIIGGNRSLLQYFSYEVLFLLALCGTAIASGTWSMTTIIHAQIINGSYFISQLFGFLLAFAGLIGKLKRDPFDIPKAKSEVIVGPLTEFSGAKLALWQLAIHSQVVVGLSLMLVCFFGGLWGFDPWAGFAVSLLLLLFLQFALSSISAIFTRLRIDQLVALNWRVFIPLSLLHVFLVIYL